MPLIKVKILDHEYLIRSEEDAQDVNKIADYVNQKLREINEVSKDLTEKNRAILASLHIASDYFQALKECDELRKRLKERTEALISNINAVMG